MRALTMLLALLAGPLSHGPLSTVSRGTVTGTVTDAASGVPLSGAHIYIEGLNTQVLSASDGSYLLRIPAVAASEVVIRVELIGYAPMSRRISARADSLRLDFALLSMAAQDNARSEDEAIDEARAGVARALANARTAREAVRSRAVAVAVMPSVMPMAELARVRGGGIVSGRYDPDFQREGYERIYENEFMAAAANPLSTFGVDVDRASYANVRRFIREGRLPPADAVRVEELVNYFTYDLPEPEGRDPFSVTTEVSAAPWNPLHKLLRIGLQGRKIDIENLPPSNLVFLIDVSGSMRPANKLPLLKSAFRMLVDQLRPQDRVAMVVYAGAAGVVLEPTAGSEKEKILEALTRLEAGGSTAGGAGLRLAYDVAQRHHVHGGNNRVILATDGDFNVGASSDAEMVRLIEKRRREGTFLTVLGFGTGNLQDAKMEKIADHGNGNYSYIDSVQEARKVLVTELGGTLFTIAKDVKIQVEFNPARVKAYRLIGYENRLLAAEDFRDDSKDAGDMGAGHTVTALYEIVPVGVNSGARIRGLDDLRYQDTTVRGDALGGSELAYVKLRYKDPEGKRSRLLSQPVLDETTAPSSDFTFAASVAAFGMVLRDSEHVGATDLETVLRWARSSVGADVEGYRTEFLRLVEAAQRLSAVTESEGPMRR